MGGAEVFTHEILKRWAEAGNEVTLFTSKFKDCKEEESSDGVRILRQGGKYFVYRKARQFYNKYQSREGYDIVIDEINTRPFFTPNFVKDQAKIIVLIHQLAREYWFYETPFPINYLGYHFLEKRWLKNYRNIPTVTVSESTKTDLVHLGFQKVFVVSEGLNFKPLERLGNKENRPVVVYVGRLKRAKRPDHAVEAFKIVKRKVPNAELWIFGDGYFKDKLKSISSEEVKFFESVTNEERREFIEKAWVLVNPSIREGYGLNVIEANALGVPCVAYDVPGLRDSILNGQTGILAKSGHIESLAQEIINLLTNESLRVSLSKSALAYSKGFSWDKAAGEFMKVVKSSGDPSAEPQ
jgi:glycosyltransferase involved in cell wall biosynthesis